MSETKEPKTETTPLGAVGPSEVGDVAANPRIKNCQRKSRKPAECYRLSACELSSTALRKCPYFTTQLPKRAFIAKHLNIGSGAARPATPDTTSSGKALNGDFTNTAHQRSTRPTIAFAQSCDKIAMGVVSKTDENGNFILEACGQPNMKMARHFLEWQHPEKWGKRRKRHVPHKT